MTTVTVRVAFGTDRPRRVDAMLSAVSDVSTELREASVERGNDLVGDIFWSEKDLDTDWLTGSVEIHRHGVQMVRRALGAPRSERSIRYSSRS